MWSVAGMQRRASVPASGSVRGAGDMHTVGVGAQALHRHHAADLELITVRLGSQKLQPSSVLRERSPAAASLACRVNMSHTVCCRTSSSGALRRCSESRSPSISR